MKLKKKKLGRLKLFPKQDIVIILIFALIIGANALFCYYNKVHSVKRAEVYEVQETYSDGGLIYQKMTVLYKGEEHEIKQEVSPVQENQYTNGDKVILENYGEEYRISGFDQTRLVMASLVIIALLLIISVGFDDLREILPVLLILPFVFSGLLFEALERTGFIVTGILFFIPAIFITAFSVSNKRLITVAASLSGTLTILSMMFLSYLIFDFFHLGMTFSRMDPAVKSLDFADYKVYYIFSMILVIFGLIVNSSIATARRAIKLTNLRIPWGQIVKQIVVKSQSDITRRLNSMFYLVLGFSFINLVYSFNSRGDYWNDSIVAGTIVYFIISVLSVILSVFFSAGIVTFYLAKSAENKGIFPGME